MKNLFEICDPDTGAVIDRIGRKEWPQAARQAMAEKALDRRLIVFTGECEGQAHLQESHP